MAYKYSYDPEADVLAITLAPRPFDYAEQTGDFIVHFDKKNKPVYVEILNAHEFVTHANMTMPKAAENQLVRSFQSA